MHLFVLHPPRELSSSRSRRQRIQARASQELGEGERYVRVRSVLWVCGCPSLRAGGAQVPPTLSLKRRRGETRGPPLGCAHVAEETRRGAVSSSLNTGIFWGRNNAELRPSSPEGKEGVPPLPRKGMWPCIHPPPAGSSFCPHWAESYFQLASWVACHWPKARLHAFWPQQGPTLCS